MPTKQEVYDALCAESGPISTQDLAKKLGAKRDNIVQQLERFLKEGYAKKDEDGLWLASDKKPLAALKEDPPGEDGLGVTEFEQFTNLGKKVGIPKDLLSLTVDHVWDGGDYKNLKWVQKAFAEMGIRTELAARWLNSWATYLKRQGVPLEDAPAPQLSSDGKSFTDSGGDDRSYGLDDRDRPVYVGEGLGDMSRKEAFELAKIRGGAMARAGVNPAANALNPADMLIQLITALQSLDTLRGAGAAPKPSYIAKPGTDGGWEIDEIQEGKPVLVGAPAPTQSPKKTYLVDKASGQVQAIEGDGAPIVVQGGNGGSPQAPKYLLVDKATGHVEEQTPGQPIIIIQQPTQQPAPQQMTPIMLNGPDGKPITMDLSTYIRIEEFKSEEKRREDSHKTKQELALGFKELLQKAAKVAETMATHRPAAPAEEKPEALK